MIDFLNIEKHALKRVKNYMVDISEKEKIHPDGIKLVIKYLNSTLSVYLYNQSRYLKTLELKSIVEYFGQEYNESQSKAVVGYIEMLALEHKTEVSELNIVICENKGQPGAYLYAGMKYLKQIPAFELLSHFYFS